MRIAVAPAGSRGDFQPLLALSVALQGAGHQVRMITSPDFVAEARAFEVPAIGLGLDLAPLLVKGGFEPGPLRAAVSLLSLGRRLVRDLVHDGLEACRGVELVVGAGAQIAAPTIAERLGVPYAFVAYSPQALRSAHHPPFTSPFLGLPAPLNRALWLSFSAAARAFLGAPLERARAELDLPPVDDLYHHFFPARTTLLAADPELQPPPPDLELAGPPLGALHLDDARALAPELEAFLAEGPPPVYLGFGSMPDPQAEATTRAVLEVAEGLSCRVVLSSGWAGYGGVTEGARALSRRVLAVGPASHRLLFPRVAAVVHHGGAGTTGAAARAGRPQLVVPHIFDQFLWSRAVTRAGLGRELPRRRLTASALGQALEALLGDEAVRTRAEALGQRLRARDAAGAAVAALERLAAGA